MGLTRYPKGDAVFSWASGRAEAARGGCAGDGAGRLGAQQLLELAVRVTLGGDGGAVEVDFGLGGGDVRLDRGRDGPGGRSGVSGHHGARGGDGDGEDQSGGSQGDAGLLPHAAGGGEVRYLAERAAAASAFIAVRVTRAVCRDGDGRTRLRSGTGRTTAAPGGLGGQKRFLSGEPAKLAVGFGSERSKTRSAVASIQAQRHPRSSLGGVCLPLTDFTPRLLNSRKWFPRLCQKVILRLIRWQSSASDQVTLWYRY